MNKELVPLSERTFKVLSAVSLSKDKFGFPPTMKEIGATVGITSNANVSYHLDKLIEGGYLAKRPNASRGLKVIIEPKNAPLDFNPNEVFSTEDPTSAK